MQLKSAQLELMKVQTARLELEYRILEREEDIKRMQEAILIQIKREKELEAKLAEK